MAHENKGPKISLRVPGFLQQAVSGPKCKPILHKLEQTEDTFHPVKMIEDVFLNPADGLENFRHPSLTISFMNAMGKNRY